jgi:hypothetical protein
MRMFNNYLKCKSCFLVVLTMSLLGAPALAQQRIAEAEYAIQDGSSQKVTTRWILFAGKSGDYELQSEIQNLPSHIRLIQVETLNEALIPTSIGYRLYAKGTEKAAVSVTCEFPAGTITCRGQSRNGPPMISKPYKYPGSFWLFLEGLSALDMPWLLDGALNRAIAQSGSLQLSTITVSGGGSNLLTATLDEAKLRAVNPGATLTVPSLDNSAEWSFSSEMENEFKFAGTETIQVKQEKISTKHYVLSGPGEPMHLWITRSGILVKIDDVVLINYKQYRKLIPELKVDAPAGSQPTQK